MLRLDAAVKIQVLLEAEAQELRLIARRAAGFRIPSPRLLEHLYDQAEQCQAAADEMAVEVAAAARREREGANAA